MSFRLQNRVSVRTLVGWILGAGLIGLVGGSPAQAKSTAPQGWYAPAPEDFRKEYDADTVNQREQSWDDYWGSVRKFYSGGRFLMIRRKGWTAECEGFLQSLTSPAVKGELQEMLNEAGKQLAAEWAKDKSVRRINDDQLKRWADRIKQARNSDGGSGELVKKTAVAIRSEIGTVLAQGRGGRKQTASR